MRVIYIQPIDLHLNQIQHGHIAPSSQADSYMFWGGGVFPTSHATDALHSLSTVFVSFPVSFPSSVLHNTLNQLCAGIVSVLIVCCYDMLVCT